MDPSGFDEQTMLKEGIAAAYQKREVIKQLRRGDVVFLYSNQKGIVGCGVVSGNLQKKTYVPGTSKINEVLFKKLSPFIPMVDNPISRKDAEKIIGSKIAVIKAFFEVKNSIGAERLRRTCFKQSNSTQKKVA